MTFSLDSVPRLDRAREESSAAAETIRAANPLRGRELAQRAQRLLELLRQVPAKQGEEHGNSN